MATKNKKYEELSKELLTLIMTLHERNKKRIKFGKIFILTLPIIMILIRLLTDGDKIVFLIIWVITMFLTAVYLIGIEYLDETIKKQLSRFTDEEVELDSLLESTDLRQKLKDFRSDLKKKGGSK